MTVLSLPGLTPYPLSSYLSAVGLLRVVHDQLDAGARGAWERDQLVLHGPSREELVAFLTERFAPSPVFSPWNKEGDPTLNATTGEQLDRICGSGDPRFDGYRAVVLAWSRLQITPIWTRGTKEERLTAWRAVAPDDALGWLDAAVALTPDRVSFPPLLGSGGNDGRFEFARLLHGELVRLFVDARSAAHGEGWLNAFLFAEEGPPLVDSTMGMYDGNAAGTPNSAPTGSAKSASNPWSVVLAFEGLIGFGASVASRDGTGRTQLAGAPFMVRAARLGGDSSAEEDARGELWAPLWSRPASWPELRRMIGEGRLDWNGRAAIGTVDAARAVATLGVDRGIGAFARHQIVKRNGLSFVATPAGRVAVRSVRGIGNLAAIDLWLGTARSSGSAAVQGAARGVDRAMAAVAGSATQDRRALGFQQVLVALADLERAVGRSSAARERTGPFPLRRAGQPVLEAADWVALTDDGTAEARLGAALASLRAGATTVIPSVALGLRGLAGTDLIPRWVESPGGTTPEERAHDAAATEVARAGGRAVQVILRRRLQAARETPAEVGPRSNPAQVASAGTPADGAGYSSGWPVGLADVRRLLAGEVDIGRVLRLAAGFALLDGWTADGPAGREPDDQLDVDPWYAVVRLCLHDQPVRTPSGVEVRLPSRRRWGRLLGSPGGFAQVGHEALVILRRAGLTDLRSVAPPPNLEPDGAAVALLLRLHDARPLARRLATLTPSSMGAAPDLTDPTTTQEVP